MWSKVKILALVVVSALVLSLILAPAVNIVSPARATVSWTKYSVTMEGEEYVVDAWVIKDGATYKMWYTHGNTDLSISQIYNSVKGLNLTDLISAIYNLDEEEFLDNLSDLTANTTAIKQMADGSSAVIGYATSTDGKTWTLQASNALPGSTVSAWTSVGAPCVIKDDTAPASQRYKMWYTGVNTTLTEPQVKTILTALGTSANRTDAFHDLLNSTYTYIGYAHSTDGASWTDQGEVFSLTSSNWTVLNSVGAPCLIKDGSTYKMWYTRIKTDVTPAVFDSILADIANFSIDDMLDLFDGTATVIGYATSADGTTGWTVQDPEVLPGSTPLWESVGDPCVIKSDGTYEMWYTNSSTNLTTANFNSLIGKVRILDIAGLWSSAASANISGFITDLLNATGSLDIAGIKTLLTGSRSTIGYATSSDGINWSVSSALNLTGRGNNPWGSAAAPSVVKSSTQYEMWYTDGVDDITWQNFLDLFLGSNLPIGHATYTYEEEEEARRPSGGGAAAAVSGTIKSDDNLCWVTIAKDTECLTKYGTTLTRITIVPMDEPPDIPEDHDIIGLAYEFKPAGATFDPPISVTFTYDESLIPTGADEENLFIAVWNATTGDWDKLDATVNSADNTISAQISHFSILTVLVSTRPAAFVASDLSISPAEVDIGDTVTISLQVANTGDLEGTYEVTLKANNVMLETKEVTLYGGASQTVTFTTSSDVAGTCNVTVDSLSGSFKVREAPVLPPPPPPPAPAAFTVSSLSVTPAEVDIAETVTITLQLANTGELEGTYKVTLKINNMVVDTREISLAGGASKLVTFTTSRDAAGTFTVTVDGLSGSFKVREAPAPPPITPPEEPKPFNWWLVIGPVIGVVIVGVIVGLVVTRRREFRNNV